MRKIIFILLVALIAWMFLSGGIRNPCDGVYRSYYIPPNTCVREINPGEWQTYQLDRGRLYQR
jgi:hypothetical protein